MCTEIGTIATFIYLATWCTIIYYINNPGSYRVLKIFTIIAANATVLCLQLKYDCHVNYIKFGAATEAVLLLLLCHVSGKSSTGYSTGYSTGNSRSTQTARQHTTKNRCMEERTRSKNAKTTGKN